MLTIIILLVGNTQELLDYYGLSGTKHVIKQSAGHAISTGLGKIDTFSFTDKVVTFMVWALIGVLCFSVVQVIARIYREIEEEEKLSSNRYVHPKTFTRGVFWRRVALDFLGVVVGLALLIGGLYCLLAYVLPIALTYTQSFLTGVSVVHAGSLVVGFFMLYGWTLILAIVLKYIVNRHRLFTR